MEEKRPQAPNRTGEPIAPQRSSAPQGAALYLRWLGILCAIMAAFCLGVFAIGYKDPSVGRVVEPLSLENDEKRTNQIPKAVDLDKSGKTRARYGYELNLAS